MAIKYVDETALNSLIGKIKTGLSTKVNSVNGMGLSQNSFTNEEKTKLTGIAAGAEVNILESVSVNDSALTVTNKAVNITIPTDLSQLSNSTTQFQNDQQVSDTVASAIGNVSKFDVKVVAILPETGLTATIYLIESETTGVYNQYVYVDNSFVNIGTTAVALVDYVRDDDLISITSTEINTVWEE